MKQLRKMRDSLSAKVFLAIFCMILPINTIALFSTGTAIKKTIEQVCLAKQNMMNMQIKDLEKRMNLSTSFLSYFITKDADAAALFHQKVMDENYKLAKMRFFSKIRSGREMIDGADGYFFYMKELEDWLKYGTVQEKADICDYEIVGERPRGWSLYESRNGKQYLIYSFEQEEVLYGCWFRTDVILKQVKESIAYENTIAEFQNESVESDYEKYQIAVGAGKLFLKVQLNRKEVLDDLKMYPLFIQISLILFILVIPTLYWIIRQLILIPMDIIRTAHQKMQTGDQEYRIKEVGNSTEVKNIYESFNVMADNLQKYKFNAYENEIARRDMEILNLQLQIRPHFLLNMFNLLYMLLIEGDSENLQDVILYLSNYFRYIFRDGKGMAIFVKEFELIMKYIDVASIRYGGRVTVDYDIDPKLMFIRIPPLLIHNFVENAVKHGIKEQGILHIFIAGEYEKGIVRFTILDDGNGIDEDTLEENRKILRGEYENKVPEAHLGLYNSYRRLRYAYGDSAAVVLDSVLQKGTRYTIVFNYDLDGEKNEVIDCE